MIIKRPLAWCAVCAVAGTWLGASFDVPFRWIVVAFIFFLSLSVAAGILCRKYAQRNTLLLSFVIVGITVLLGFWGSSTFHIRQSDLSLLESIANNDDMTVDVIGSVAGDPFIYKNRYGSGWIWKFPLRLQKLEADKISKVSENCSGVITVKWYGPPPGVERIYGNGGGVGPEYGDQWQMTGKMRVSKYSKRKENYVFITGRRRSSRISEGVISGVALQCLAARRAAADKLSVGIEDFPEQVSILRAILLGYRSDLARDMRTLFANVGTLHVFAISGLHVGIICSLIIFVLSVCTIPRTHWVLLLAPLLIAYTFATGARPSAIRACIMAIIYFGAPLVWRKADSISTVSLAAILILAVAPQQLFQVGFIYSFIVVLGLIVFYPIIHHALSLVMQHLRVFKGIEEMGIAPLFWQKDDFQVQDEPTWIIRIRKFAHYMISLFALSCSAWLASVPLTAYFFGQFSPVALVGNIFVIPLAFLVVVTGALSLVFGSCFVLLGDIFNHANLLIITVLVKSMQVISKLPGAFFEIEKVPLWFVFAWYAVLLSVVYTYKRRTKQSSVFSNQ